MNFKVILFIVFSVLILNVSAQVSKINPVVFEQLNNFSESDKVLVWVFFTDKGDNTDYYFANPTKILSQRAIDRRAKLGSFEKGIDFLDLPVSQTYIEKISNAGIGIKNKSKYLNGISCYANQQQLSLLNSFNFVKNIELVEKYKSINKIEENLIESSTQLKSKGLNTLDYGSSFTQLQQINVPAVHDMGINGNGVIVGVLDAGFNNLPHEAFANMDIIAAYDFVNNDPDVGDGSDMGEGSHGTQTLSTIGGFKQGHLIGPAYGANYILAKTENTDSETPIEEDNWIAAVEWMDSIGVDVTSTSLGYIDFDSPYIGYTWQSMNGNTCRITIAADIAVTRGIVVVNSAGNEGPNSSHNTLGAPADGFNVIAVGAVTSSGSISSFSSVGPTVDGRIKPDVMAMGSSVHVAGTSLPNQYTYSSGTSFSGPLAGGVAALVLSAMPGLTPFQVREAMRNTASLGSNPNNQYGWGILNAFDAVNYYKVQIEHTPLGDTENPNRIHKINAKIVSVLPLVQQSIYLFYQTTGKEGYDSLLMNPSGVPNYFEATIPVTQSNVTVKYYIMAKNSSGLYTKLPGNAPNEVFQFKVGADQIPPTVTHSPLSVQSIYAWPPTLSATVTDNLGVKQVKAEYKLNDGSLISFDLLNINGTNVYEATFPIAVVNVGDVISYRLIAIDSAIIANSTVLPVPGYYSFIVENVIVYTNDFNTNNGDLEGTNDWQWGTTVSPYPTPHSGTKLWGTKLISNYTNGPLLSTLVTPEMTVIDNNPGFSFWHTYNFESSYDGGNVKISKNGGPFTLITPIGGYQGVLSSSFDNPLGGQQAFVGSSNWTQAQFDLTGIVSSGDNIKIRFDFGVDNMIAYLGWYIDDLSFMGAGAILPVEMVSFDAILSTDGKINLNWVTVTEENNLGFEVEFSSDKQNFNKIGFVKGYGTTSEIRNYSFTDSRIIDNVGYYRLKQIDYNGTVSISQIVEVHNNINYEFVLEQNYPNPFNPTTNIGFMLKENGLVRLTVYNLLGEKVAELINGEMNLGKYNISFDANKYGLTGGVYFVELSVKDKFRNVKKISLIK